MNFNNTDNHSDDWDGHRAPLPCTRPSLANQPLFSPAVPASFLEQQYSLSTASTQDGEMEKNSTTNKYHQRITNSYAYRVRDHVCYATVKMGPESSELMKGKLRLGARIIQKGGWENIFKEVFWENEGEKLLKASQCYLSTTADPIVGILFISTQKVAFCSDRPITLRSGDLSRQPYKVVMLTNKIKEANEKNVENPSQKYIQIVTADSSEFWFMGFVRYEKAFHNLRKALSLDSN